MDKELGKNVIASVDGDILTLKIDLSKNYGLSGSGKSTIIATTQGNVTVAGVKLGLNVYK